MNRFQATLSSIILSEASSSFSGVSCVKSLDVSFHSFLPLQISRSVTTVVASLAVWVGESNFFLGVEVLKECSVFHLTSKDFLQILSNPIKMPKLMAVIYSFLSQVYLNTNSL